MIQTITNEDTLKILEELANIIEDKKEYLTQLDSVIGDGDHGINLCRGFTEVRNKLRDLEGRDIGTILKTVGSVLVSSVGGAVGPLYGVAFIRAGDVAMGKYQVDLKDLVRLFSAAEEGIISIGGAKVGEKTVLDALHPAVEALREASEKNLTLIDSLEKSVNAGEEGMKSTTEMLAKKGRSIYLGERARGHQDVGASSCYLILRSALETLKKLHQSTEQPK